MTNLTIKELKAICTERNIAVTGDKRLKASYINAISQGLGSANETFQAEQTVAEIELPATPECFDDSYEFVISTETVCQEVTIDTEAGVTAEAIADHWFERAVEPVVGMIPLAPAPRSAVAVLLIPIIMVITAIGSLAMMVRVLVPILKSLYTATAGVVRSVANQKVSQSIDYFPVAQPAI